MSKFFRNSVLSLVIFVTISLVSCDRCEKLPNFTRLLDKDEGTCKNFIECLNGVEQGSLPCPDDFYFNERTMACDWKVNVPCGSSNVCAGKENGDVVADPTECTKYYVCSVVGGITTATLTDCAPAGQIFNPFSGVSPPCSIATEWWCPSEDVLRPSCSMLPNNTYVFDPKDCSAYYLCVNRALIWGSCGKNMHFDFTKKLCVYGESKACSSYSGSGEEDGPSSDDICQGKTGQFLPDPKICKAYIYCLSDKLPYQGFCKNGGEFYTDGKCKTTPADTCTCETVAEGTLVKNKNNPAEYWECTGEGPVPVKCPDGYIFGEKGCMKK